MMKSEECKETIYKYFDKIVEKQKIYKNQIKRFHKNHSERFDEILEKIIHKYDSDEYYNKEINRGFEPRCSLYYFMYDYAEMYGRKLTEKEMTKYSNSFTVGIYFIKGYYIQLMQGQGSVVRIDKDEIVKKSKRVSSDDVFFRCDNCGHEPKNGK